MAPLQWVRTLFAGLLLAGACTSTPIAHSCDGPARDHVMLVDRMWCAGTFNYDDTDLGSDGRTVSDGDARKFAPDGSLRDASRRIFYHGTPHLFRQDRLLVIYSGEDQAVIAVLTRLMGNQFARG